MALEDKIIQYECGEMTEEEEEAFFQELVDSKLVWQFPGHYGRRATELIAEGRVTDNE